MKTNDIKKGTRVKMRNTGWEGEMLDNRKGKTRCVMVEGAFKEAGDVYSHNIEFVLVDGEWTKVEHTKEQLKHMETVKAMGF